MLPSYLNIDYINTLNPSSNIFSAILPFENTFTVLFILHIFLKSHKHIYLTPVYFLPSYQIIYPFPCILFFFHSPVYTLLSGQIYVPYPCISFYRNSPSYLDPSAKLRIPFPCFLPSKYYPSYLAPSGQSSIPFPCYLSFSH